MSLTSTTPRRLALDVPASAESVPRVRHALLDAGLDVDLDHTVSLLTSEVLSNAVRHARSGAVIHVEGRFADGYACIAVTDGGAGFDPEIRHTASGFGLRLVDKLATSWAVESEGSGTRVWFEVDRRARRFDRAPAA